jgi:hypothetical protein
VQGTTQSSASSEAATETNLRYANSLSWIYQDSGKPHRRAGHFDQADEFDRRRVELWL